MLFYKLLMKKARIAIAPRQGWPINKGDLKILQDLGGQIDVLPLQIPASASSELRHNPDLAQIPKEILSLLFEQNLYGLRNTQ